MMATTSRILPMVSYGAASNLDDLLYLRGVDLAVTQSDVFEHFRTELVLTHSCQPAANFAVMHNIAM
jgi:hypothetical protein